MFGSRSLNQVTTNRVQTAFGSAVDQWLEVHPVLAWLVHHPLATAGFLLLLLLLLQGLFGAIARFSERFWLSLFQSPLKLGRWFLGMGARSLKTVATREPTTGDRQEKLTVILNRLEAIRLEQEMLLGEMKSILSRGNIDLEKQQKSLEQIKPKVKP